MNGPPTPPSSNDELPSSTIPTPSTEPTPEPIVPSDTATAATASTSTASSGPSPYVSSFSKIAPLVAKAEYREVIRLAERADQNTFQDTHPTRLFIIAPLVLSYLIVDDLAPARYALTRLPHAIASLPLSQGLFSLFAAVYERRYERVYSRAEGIYNMAQESDFPDADLAAVLSGLINAFVEAFRRRTLALISKAYSSLPLSLAHAYLGLDNEQLLAAAETKNWTFDASTQILTPSPASREAPQSHSNGIVSVPSSLVTFDSIVDSVARLEA
ncbi:COP9 signalosome [Amylostereum chailletii]|nr:COP9 signalosome [Amylostereum chailletii]